MQRIIFGFLLVVVTTSTIASDFQHKDLNDPTKLCGIERATCDPNKSPNLSRNFTVRNCMCDPQCATYGDCCVDSPYFKDAEQRRAVTLFNCMPMPTDELSSFYMKQSCPASWKLKDIRHMCEKSMSINLKDPLLMTPVTDRQDNITYGNIFCSLCHGHPIGSKHQDVWKIGFRCPHNSPLTGKDDTFLDRVTFNKTNNYWQIIDNNNPIPCSFHLIIPKQVKPRLTACQQSMMKNCPATWIHEHHSHNSSANAGSNLPSRESIRDSCESYTMTVYPENYFSDGNLHTSYRNVHCAMCNSIKIQNLMCDNPITAKFRVPDQADVPPLTILFDFTSIKLKGNKNCKLGQIYDTMLKTCKENSIENPNPICDYPITTESGGLSLTDIPSFSILFDFNSIMEKSNKNCDSGQN